MMIEGTDVPLQSRFLFSFLLAIPALCPASPPTVQYNRDVRPILADKCFRCHGPDAAARQSDMRLDLREEATEKRGGYQVIRPGKPAVSELIRRITTADDEERMPPRDSGLTLRPDEIELLRRWIKDGAEYQPHWSFVALRRAEIPEVRNLGWLRNAIDRFVLARLELEGLSPSAEASMPTLIRRVTLDLTGLPPTLNEIETFQQESTHNPNFAFRNLVNRLLSSPRFGERMAAGWLDAARYADTNGYFTDNDRTMWRWRDWVIGALNDNMPFDQFTIEQLAGDLLPNSTIEQRIATGFNRNHMVNNETGIVEEEFRVEYVVDRVDTTATVWMGLTVGCARCHDHKYDPISQKDFYRFFAFFNNVPERGLSGSSGNAAPFLRVPTAAQQSWIGRLNREVAEAEKEFNAIEKQLAAAQHVWESTAIESLPMTEIEGLTIHLALENEPTGSEIIGSVRFTPAMLGNGAKFHGDGCINVKDIANFDRSDTFSYGAWIQPASAGCVMSKMDDANEMRGFDVTLRKGKAVVNLVHRWNSNAIRVLTSSSIATRQWQHLMVTYDGSSKAKGVKVYLDGQPQPVDIAQDTLTGTIRNNEPFRIGRRQASASYEGLIDDVRLYDRRLTDDEVKQLASSQFVRGIVGKPSPERNASQKRKLRDYFIEHHADRRFGEVSERLTKLRALQRRHSREVPTTMVMQESEKPRQAFVLVRGQYDQHGESVSAGVPEFLLVGRIANPSGTVDGLTIRPTDRLGLAKWLVDSSNPLTARVTVNRIWQQLFGTGIVKTADDFGTQGDRPSHPELLDWLAIELIESGWDIKHLVRTIVTSAAYRQSSNYSPELLRRDPENRLLARGPRVRMDAEMLRDNALAISGLLVEKLGGPSVKPYQPAGLWKDVTYDSNLGYQQDKGPSLYRRGLYTFWKRQSPPPAMLVFDAPTREICTITRSRTNTPLQALALMNDPTFVEASRKLAERMMLSSRVSLERIKFAFRLATARQPTSYESKVLLDVFRNQKQYYEHNQDDALKLVSVGESSHNKSLNVSELAAWTTVTSMILCLDETITKR